MARMCPVIELKGLGGFNRRPMGWATAKVETVDDLSKKFQYRIHAPPQAGQGPSRRGQDRTSCERPLVFRVPRFGGVKQRFGKALSTQPIPIRVCMMHAQMHSPGLPVANPVLLFTYPRQCLRVSQTLCALLSE